MKKPLLLFCVYILSVESKDFLWGGLYPKESESREVKPLDGIWTFRISPKDDPDKGFREKWYSKPLSLSGDVIHMAVPSSYNDVTQDVKLRDHIGWAWWKEANQQVFLRLGSAHYSSIIYINGKAVTSHEGGHLPILSEISKFIDFGKENLIVVAVNNTLTPDTIPQGKIIYHNNTSRYPEGYFEQKLDFDFFNYAGLHRPIFLYTTPQVYIEDIVVTTDIKGTTGIVSYSISYGLPKKFKSKDNIGCSTRIFDKKGIHIVSSIGCRGRIAILNASFWWPYLMHSSPGYMYLLEASLSDDKGNLDIYLLKFGIRTVSWSNTSLYINGKSVYLRGCGKHEDADIRGKGVDYALIVKDFSLLKWLGANSFRTSHYPYAEEIMDMADEEGIMVIDESPAVGLNGFGKDLLKKHKTVMKELVLRDKNRPSVIMWSVGNEPESYQLAAKNYFKEIVEATHSFDGSRPVTCVLNADKVVDLAAQSLDVILVNRYYSWYSDTGYLEVIELQTVTEFTEWHKKYNKPVMISEYGAGSVPGLHKDPPFTWSEEYQVALMLHNFKAFDKLREIGFFIGEMIWNFADFATPQEYNRPGACMKGLFTRNRQPKMAGHIMRCHYWILAERLDNCSYQELPLCL